jgi:hypothetical protein
MGMRADKRHRDLVAGTGRGRMIEGEQLPSEDGGDYVAFHAAGVAVRGSFRCAECSHGVVVTGSMPSCPMCGGTVWEESAKSPFRGSTSL